jgi:uncharacterized protein (TIGR02996 family)
MSAERAALLAAIVARPDEQTPRLVYADWLDEFAESLTGEERVAVSAQAEALRLHAGLSSAIEGVPDTDDGTARTRQLDKRHEERWLAGVPKYARTWVRLTGGLPTRLEITARLLLKNGKRLRRDVPYTALRLRNATGLLEEIVNAGLLVGVHQLDLSFNALGDSELGYLFRSPDAAAVRDLDVAHIRFGDAVADQLASSAPLSHLQRLNVWWCAPCVGRALATSKTLVHLKRLQIGNSGLDVPALAALVAAPLAAGLEDLEISYNTLGEQTGEVLARAPELAHLRRVSMWSCGLGDGGTTELARSPHLRQLESMGLNGNAIGARGLGALARSPVVASVRALALENNGLRDDAISALVTNAAFRTLQRIELGGVAIAPNRIGAVGVKTLVSSPLVRTLRDLDLYGNETLGADGARAIAEAEGLTDLAKLDLGRCALGPEGGVVIAAARYLVNLRCVRLSGNQLGSRGVAALASAPWLATARELHLFDNPCGSAAQLLLDNPHIDKLESLTLDGNRLKPETRAKFTARLGDRVRF